MTRFVALRKTDGCCGVCAACRAPAIGTSPATHANAIAAPSRRAARMWPLCQSRGVHRADHKRNGRQEYLPPVVSSRLASLRTGSGAAVAPSGSPGSPSPARRAHSDDRRSRWPRCSRLHHRRRVEPGEERLVRAIDPAVPVRPAHCGNVSASRYGAVPMSSPSSGRTGSRC